MKIIREKNLQEAIPTSPSHPHPFQLMQKDFHSAIVNQHTNSFCNKRDPFQPRFVWIDLKRIK